MAEKKNAIPLTMAPGGEARAAPLMRHAERTATAAIEAIEAGQPLGESEQTLAENLLDNYVRKADELAADANIPDVAHAAVIGRAAIEAVQGGRPLTSDQATIAITELEEHRRKAQQLAEQYEAVVAAQADEDATE